MSIKSKTGFSGKLLYINKVEMDSRAEISINKFYQGMITLYRVSRDCKFGERRNKPIFGN